MVHLLILGALTLILYKGGVQDVEKCDVNKVKQ